MAFNVTYSFNNGAVTGTATSITALRSAIYNFAHSGSVSSSTGFNYNYLTQCTLSGTAEGQLTTGDPQGTTTGLFVGLFFYCSSLTSLDVSNFDTSNVTDMTGMFDHCSSLTLLDLSNWNTSNVTNMAGMFNNCSSLTSLDVSNFDTSNVTDMAGMFNNCSSLTSLDLSNLNTSNVTDMSWMFYGCSTLASLDLSSFNTSNVTQIACMFYGCESLEHIYTSNEFVTIQLTNSASISMFNNCTLLPNFDSSKTGKTMAYIGGYFEEVPTSIEILDSQGNILYTFPTGTEVTAELIKATLKSEKHLIATVVTNADGSFTVTKYVPGGSKSILRRIEII